MTTKAVPARSIKALEKEGDEIARKAAILHPDLPANHLAEILLDELEPEFRSELSRLLLLEYFTHTLKSERRRMIEPADAPLLFEGLYHLPRRIILKGKRYDFQQANASQLRAYLKTLNEKHKGRIADVKAVLERLEKYTAQKRGITVAAVSALEAKNAVEARPASARKKKAGK